jgi:rod shape determining protein RodA
VLGIVAMAVCLTIDYRSLADKSHWIYLGIVLLLMYVLFFGAVRGGSRRWIDLGAFNLQPSEFAKAALALTLAKFFGESRRGAITREDLAIAGALTAVPLILIARQPDLGTAVTLIPVGFAIAYVAGMPMRLIGILALAAVLVAPVAWKFALKDYQRGPHLDISRSLAGCQGRGVSADSGADHGRIRRSVGKRIYQGNAGPVAFPACRTQ